MLENGVVEKLGDILTPGAPPHGRSTEKN